MKRILFQGANYTNNIHQSNVNNQLDNSRKKNHRWNKEDQKKPLRTSNPLFIKSIK